MKSDKSLLRRTGCNADPGTFYTVREVTFMLIKKSSILSRQGMLFMLCGALLAPFSAGYAQSAATNDTCETATVRGERTPE